MLNVINKKKEINILNNFLFFKAFKTFLMIFVSLNSIMYSINFTKVSNRLFNMPFYDIFVMINYLTPFSMFETMSYVLVMSLSLCLYQLFSSNELIVIKILGYDNRKISRPFIIVVFLIFIISIVLQIIYPYTIKKHIEQRKLYESAGFINILKKNTFNDLGEQTIIFKKIRNNNKLKDVILIKKDQDTDTVILANSAILGLDLHNKIMIKFDEGSFIKFKKNEKSFYYSENQEGELNLSKMQSSNMQFSTQDLIEMQSTFELYQKTKDDQRSSIEFHRRMITSLQLLSLGFIILMFLLKKNNSRVEKRFFDYKLLIIIAFLIVNTSFGIPFFIKRNLCILSYFPHFLLISVFLIKFLFLEKRYNLKKI